MFQLTDAPINVFSLRNTHRTIGSFNQPNRTIDLRYQRVIATVLTVVFLTSMSGFTQGVSAEATPNPEADEALASRLGGTRASFRDAFGDPTIEDTVNGTRYELASYGMVWVQYLLTGKDGFDPDDRAVMITLRSPRPEDKVATTPDPNDWKIDQALRAILRFLPEDVSLEGSATPVPGLPDDSTLERSCRSDALAAVFSDLAETGSCQIAFLMPTPVTVSYITLLLGADDSRPGASNPCGGMAEWGQQSGARMETALSILGEISGIDETAADAPDQLRGLSGQFGELSGAQEQETVPPRAVRVNPQLVLAFQGFATAVDNAATGLEQGDDNLLGQAVTDLESARSLFDAANALVLSALQRCDLID